MSKRWRSIGTAPGRGRAKPEVIEEFKQFGVEAMLVAFDIESVTGSPPCTNEYVAEMRDRNRGVILQAWAAVDPLKGDRRDRRGEESDRGAKDCSGFIFIRSWAISQSMNGNFIRCGRPSTSLKVPVMIDVGTTGMGAGMPGGLGAVIRHAHPAAIDQLAADFPNLNIVAAHPGWPWNEEMIAVALHKGNVSWELSGWAPKYFPDALKRDIKGRLKDKIMFGSDYPSIPYERIFKEWNELGYSDELMEKIFHGNAERILGL